MASMESVESKMTVPTTTINPYLAMREAKIARNAERLSTLGFGPKTTVGSSRSKDVDTKRADTRSRAPKRKSRANAMVIVTDERPRRRSSRLTVTKDLSGTSTSPLKGSNTRSDTRAVIRSNPLTAAQLCEQSDRIVSPPLSSPLKQLAKNSARSMHLDVSRLAPLLGVPLSKTGKACAMETSALHGVDEYEQRSSISFNKYSGVQEWANDAVFLWINLGAPQSEVLNSFLEEGTQVTWYGGSRMHDGTKAVQTLVRVGLLASKNATDLATDSECSRKPDKGGVVLWCRQYRHSRKGFEPYVCLGRLALVSYDPASQPLQFLWKLLDYEKMVSNENEQIRKTFYHITGCRVKET